MTQSANWRLIISIADILAGAYLLIGVIRIAFVETPVDLLFYPRWIAVAAGYLLMRAIKVKWAALWILVVTGMVEAVISAGQWAGMFASNHSMFDVTGTFGNPGQLAGFLAVAATVVIGLLFERNPDVSRRWGQARFAAGISVLAILTAMMMADSRASFVALAVGLAVYFGKPLGRWLRRWWRVVFPVLAVMLILGGIGMYRYRPGSADARLLVWRVSADMIADKPIFGHGVGSFTHEYMLYQAHYFERHPDSRFAAVADNVAYPYNELLHALVEQGIAGALILIGFFVAIFGHRLRDGVQRTVHAGLATLTAFSMFSYPVDVFPLLLLFAVLAGLADSRTLLIFPKARWVKWVVAGVLLILCVSAIRHTVFYCGANRNAKMLFRKDNAAALAFIDANYDRLRGSRRFSMIYAAWLAEHPDLDRMLDLPPSCEIWCDIGNAYTAVCNYLEAEQYYSTAARMIPTRLRPNYLLWKMELQRGDTLAAIEIGNKLLTQPLKVESTFTLRAKAEVREFLEEMK